MNDLISRKALLKAVEKEENECENSGILPNWFSVSGIINRQPTAYDVNKVVEQIDNISVNRGEYSEIVNCNVEVYGHCSSNCYECILNCVTDIVKGAVKDE